MKPVEVIQKLEMLSELEERTSNSSRLSSIDFGIRSSFAAQVNAYVKSLTLQDLIALYRCFEDRRKLSVQYNLLMQDSRVI